MKKEEKTALEMQEQSTCTPSEINIGIDVSEITKELLNNLMQYERYFKNTMNTFTSFDEKTKSEIINLSLNYSRFIENLIIDNIYLECFVDENKIIITI
ncbi:MAG: hypothetical protein LBP36_03035 [Oscillospiraceae bacterium]|jgi:hypothetical protein|nr:hypothetical protein [Oscillospiraceae bacterium]